MPVYLSDKVIYRKRLPNSCAIICEERVDLSTGLKDVLFPAFYETKGHDLIWEALIDRKRYGYLHVIHDNDTSFRVTLQPTAFSPSDQVLLGTVRMC